MTDFNPGSWYWVADDGRVFSSASSSVITEDDASFEAWKAEGNNPTRWPVDDAGSQTDASLQDVLTPYGIYVDLTAYAAAKRYTVETGGYTYDSHPIATDRESQSKIASVAIAATVVGSSFSTEWKCSDGTFFTLDEADAIAMATAIMTFVSACFAAEAAAVAEITAGTITTSAEIDAVSWPANS